MPSANSHNQSGAADLMCSRGKTDFDEPGIGTGGSVSPRAAEWGEITVAQPKIWEFERVSSMLDGLLQDVEGVSLSDLTNLDPNKQNAAALSFIQSALEVGVQYDQAAAVNNANILKNYQAVESSQLEQLNAYNTYMQTLTSQRDQIARQLAAATNEVNTLQPLQSAGTITPAQTEQLAAATSRQQALQSSLTSVNSLISGAGAPPTLTAPPTVTGTSVQAPASGSSMSSSLSGFADVLKSLPSGLTNNLNTALQSPSYPATKQLDNFITLLYERLAREISVLQDDLTRDPENVPFLLQFDVGLYPSGKAKDHDARVEFNLNCPGCRVYSLYPGQSSYNLANYAGTSKRVTFWGNFLTLIGFGASASYRRQQDTLQGSLVQSVYTAGFQDSLKQESTKQDGSKTDESIQRFGWYYGSAPFEKLVSPGIHTTFAIVTVPRKLIDSTRDFFGNADACLDFSVHGAWASHDDPLAQHSSHSPLGELGKGVGSFAYYRTRTPLRNSDSDGTDKLDDFDRTTGFNKTVVNRKTEVNLPVGPPEYTLVTKREKQKLHIVSIEYDTVYEEPVSPAAGTTSPAPPPAAVTPSVAPSSSSVSPLLALDQLPCPKGECAAVLLKLDRPIDPNLVITVRGKPMKRVRDWRGRATSILPAAQSYSDQPAVAAAAIAAAPAGSAAAAAARQPAPGPSLLESDQFTPNSWFPLNSHEILLAVSRAIATDYEFPVIQVSGSSSTVVIPHEIQQNVTELIINGFRIQPQTRYQLRQDIAKNYSQAEEPQAPREANTDAPLTSGPYPFSTYLPLFLPDPPAHSVYAQIGETSEDILVGFLPDPQVNQNGGSASYPEWKEGQAQVVLEDRQLDFAWSLDCTVQGDELACHLPRTAILDAYRTYGEVCGESRCPGLDARYGALWETAVAQATRIATAKLTAPAATPATQSVEVTQPDLVAQGKRLALSWFSDTKRFKDDAKSLFVPTLEVWVFQNDPEGKYTFYSPEPAPIHFFPLSENYWDNPGFQPWYFKSADRDEVTVEGCNYYPGSDADLGLPSITVLGSFAKDDLPIRAAHATTSGSRTVTLARTDACQDFEVTTSGLTESELVFRLDRPDLKDHPDVLPILALSTSRLRPEFGHAHVDAIPSPAPPSRITKWIVDIPAHRVTAGDFLDLPDELRDSSKNGSDNSSNDCSNSGPSDSPSDSTKNASTNGANNSPKKPTENIEFTCQWRQGNVTLLDDSHWEAAKNADAVTLHLEISLAALPKLPRAIDLLRTTTVTTDKVAAKPADNNPADKNAKDKRAAATDTDKTSGTVKTSYAVGRLPNLRNLILPTKLKVTFISPTQFAIQGPNAGIIDQVGIQGPTALTKPPTVSNGFDYALVTLPTPALPTASVKSLSATSGAAGSTVLINGTGLSSSDVVKFNGNTVAHSCESSTNIGFVVPTGTAAGKPYTVAVTDSNDKPIAKDQTFTVNSTPVPPKGCTDDSQKTTGLAAGTYTIVPLVSLDAKNSLPLDVTDTSGKPLILVVPTPPKTDTTPKTPAGSTTSTVTITKTKTPPTTTPASPPAGASTQ